MSAMERSRTFNAVRNAGWAMALQGMTILCQFVTRTIFVKLLGMDYLGISDLFSNILMFLSFTDLGIGSAIIFSMYKPLAQGDTATLSALMDFYKKAYRVIAAAIAVLGVMLIPFLGVIIKEPPQIREDLTVIYLLYLLHAVLTYCYSYKKSIITADQKDYIVTIYYKAFYFLQIVLQILFLVWTRQYLLYLLMQILCSFLNNFFVSRKADRMYPFITRKPEKKLERGEIANIISNVKSLVIYRISDIVMNSIDNILISALIGVRSVALCSNYLLIESSANQLIKQAVNGFTASIGNLNAAADRARQMEIFNAMSLITAWLYGFLTIGLTLLTSPLVSLWFGDAYLIGQGVVLAMALRNYVSGIQFVPYTYRTTMNLLAEKRYMPLAGAILNLVLSILFAGWMGLAGIFVATLLSRILTTTWVDIYVVFRKGFGCSPLACYGRTLLYAGVMVANLALNARVLSLIPLGGILGFVVKVLVCSLCCNLFFLLCYFRTRAFRCVWQSALQFLNRRLSR